MELEERVLEFRTTKKASYDGKSYMTRLPAEVVHYLQERGISVEDMVLEGIWKLREKTYCVVLIFGGAEPKRTEQKEQAESVTPDENSKSSEETADSEEDNYVVIREDRFRVAR